MLLFQIIRSALMLPQSITSTLSLETCSLSLVLKAVTIVVVVIVDRATRRGRVGATVAVIFVAFGAKKLVRI